MRHSNNIEFGALRIFATIAESETLTEAAERLGVTQSAVSQALKQLEEQIEVQLVVRRSRPIRLTPSGVVLRDYALQMTTEMRSMLTDVRMASAGGLSQLNLGMIDSFADAVGMQLLPQLKPYVSKLVLRTGFNASLSEALLDRDLDVLITSDPMEAHTELECRPILRDPFVIIAPRNKVADGEASPHWLAKNLPFVHYNRVSRIGVLTDVIARRLGVELTSDYEVDSTQTLLRFVQSGHGWAIISGLCLVRHPELLRGIQVMNLSDGAHVRYISLLCRAGELGELPAKITEISRSLFTAEVIPQLAGIAPWLAEQTYPITRLPTF